MGQESVVADLSELLTSRVQEAVALGTPVRLVGKDTKHFLGREPEGERIDISGHCGLLEYEPTELVVKVRAGTPVQELQDTLGTAGQALPFEPPHFGPGATVGGTVAAGLSGPGRPYRGSARDFVLGVTCISGRGERLRFGGQVMKNVAGYDVSRLMTGAMGTLGVILDVSFKILPLPEIEQTLVFESSAEDAISTMNQWAATSLPLSAVCYLDRELRIRLSGTDLGVRAAMKELGGTADPEGDAFWVALREHQLPFFRKPGNLWRLALAPATPYLSLPGEVLNDWGGAQRWLISDADDEGLREAIRSVGGYATRYRGGDRAGEVFHPLAPSLAKLHRNIKRAFDPEGILNRGRLYAGM